MFGIEIVLVVDFDEFLHCPAAAGPSAAEQARYPPPLPSPLPLFLCLTDSFMQTHAYSLTLVLSFSHSHSLIHSLTHLFIHSLTHSLTHSFIHSLTHLLTHPITLIPLSVLRCHLAARRYVWYEGVDQVPDRVAHSIIERTESLLTVDHSLSILMHCVTPRQIMFPQRLLMPHATHCTIRECLLHQVAALAISQIFQSNGFPLYFFIFDTQARQSPPRSVLDCFAPYEYSTGATR